MRKKLLLLFVLFIVPVIHGAVYAVSGYNQDRAERILSKVNENIPGTMAGSAEDAAGDEEPGEDPGEETGLPGGGTLYVEVDIDFPWRNLKSALIQTAKYLTAQAKGEPEGTGGGTDPVPQYSGKKVVVYSGNPLYTGGVPEDEEQDSADHSGSEGIQPAEESGDPEDVNTSQSMKSGGNGSYVSWLDAMMDTSKYFTAQTVFGSEANENDFYRLTGGFSGRGGETGTDGLPENTGGVIEYDPGHGYGSNDLIYYPGDIYDLSDTGGIDLSGMSRDYIWHMSLSDIREGVNLGYIIETGNSSMPYAWRKYETDWSGNITYKDWPVIELRNGTGKDFPPREYFGFGAGKTEEEIQEIIDELDDKIDDGHAVIGIPKDDFAKGLRDGTIKYVGDSGSGCLYMNTTSGECVVDSRDPGTLGIISIANNALLGIVDKLYKPTSETVKVMDQGFGITSKLAVALVPLVILLTIAAAMRAGASSVTGIAEARSSAINLLFCIGLAFSSRWLLGKISSVSYSIATEIGKGAILFSDSMLTSLTFGSAILIMLFTFVFMETLINNHFSNTQ